MNIDPTVAILLATYNGEEFLKEQLDSILTQTYQNLKVYISDDSSSDATMEIVSHYQKRYPTKIFYTVNETNIGYVKNFEKLLEQCLESYILFSDQDDIWLEDKVEIQMREILKLEALNNDCACLVHSDLLMIDKFGNIVKNSYFKYRSYNLKNQKDLGHLLGPSGTMGNTILINKKLRDLVLPFPDKLDVHDYWIGVNCELFGVRKTLKKALVKYRIHANNSSNSQDKLSSKKIALNRDIKLPNLETMRKYYLPTLIPQIKSSGDRAVLDAYIDYLQFNKNRFLIYFELLKYSLVKRDLLFRVKLFFKILFTNRY